MNFQLLSLEVGVVVLALGLLLADLWLPAVWKKFLGYVAAGGVGLILLASFAMEHSVPQYAFGGMYVMDGMAMFFKRFFLLAAIFVLILAVDFSDRIQAGVSEFYVLLLFALTGMMFCASANDLVLVFVGLELITVSFYVLNSFQRSRLMSLEAGIKYLILGALASGFMVYGIALVFGAANTTQFEGIRAALPALADRGIFVAGLLLVVVGLGFKIAAFPFQIWVPDVYQGSPAPATAMLAVGSKAAGFVLLLRLLYEAVPLVALQWNQLLMVMAGVTILYGNLCAIPQRNVKRLLGYSSIAQAGYLMLGVAALNLAGSSAVLFYLIGYLFTVLAAFLVISVVMREVEGEDISAFSGLHQRSPLLAATMSLAMISLAGIPPLAGFFGKFLLLRAVLERGSEHPGYWWLTAVALVGVVISFYYYLGVVRAIYWGSSGPNQGTIPVPTPVRFALILCAGGMLYLGIFPNAVVNVSLRSAQNLELREGIGIPVRVTVHPEHDAEAHRPVRP